MTNGEGDEQSLPHSSIWIEYFRGKAALLDLDLTHSNRTQTAEVIVSKIEEFIFFEQEVPSDGVEGFGIVNCEEKSIVILYRRVMYDVLYVT